MVFDNYMLSSESWHKVSLVNLLKVKKVRFLLSLLKGMTLCPIYKNQESSSQTQLRINNCG